MPFVPDTSDSVGRFVPDQAPQAKQPTPPDTGWMGAARGVADVAATLGSGAAQQVVGVPKHLGALAEKITEPLGLSRMTPEQKAQTAQSEAQPGITEKLQGLLSHQPTTEEGKYLLGQIQSLLKPVTAIGGAIRKGSEAVIGKEATDVASDVIGLAGLKGAGTASTGARALRAAESTQSKVTKIIDNLSGGKSLEKADVGQAVQTAAGATTAAAKKVGTQAYDELSQAMGPQTMVPMTISSAEAKKYGGRIVRDPTVEKFSDKLAGFQTMTFEDLKDLRTQISDSMGSDKNVNRQLRTLRDAVTRDIDEKAKSLSPEAKQKWDIANSRWKDYIKTEDRINRVLGRNWAAKTPAEMYQKLFRAASTDPQKVITVMGSIGDPAVKKQFAASVLHHMSDTGGEFNVGKFVNQWDRMNPQARKALFSAIGGGYEENMTRLMQNLKRIQEGRTGLIKEVSGIGVAAILAHFLPGGTAAIGAVTLGREAYKFGPKAIEAYLTSPEWVRKLAESTTAALERGGGAAVVGVQQVTPNTLSTLSNAPQ